jgi:hypothetical protein
MLDFVNAVSVCFQRGVGNRQLPLPMKQRLQEERELEAGVQQLSIAMAPPIIGYGCCSVCPADVKPHLQHTQTFHRLRCWFSPCHAMPCLSQNKLHPMLRVANSWKMTTRKGERKKECTTSRSQMPHMGSYIVEFEMR